MTDMTCIHSRDADRHAAEPDPQDQMDSIVDAMLSEPSCIQRWIEDEGPDVAGLLASLLSDGLPRIDRSERDDRRVGYIEGAADMLKEQFGLWATRPNKFSSVSPAKAWIADAMDYAG